MENQEPQDLSYSNLVLRETVLKNTDEIVGVAIYCGYDSKILKNQGYFCCDIGKCTIR